MAIVEVRDSRSDEILTEYEGMVKVPRVGEYLLSATEPARFWRVLAVAHTHLSVRVYVDEGLLYRMPPK